MKSIKILAIVAASLAVVALIIGIYNAVIFNQIVSSTTGTTPVSQGQATTNFWLNIVLIVVALIILGVAVYYLLKPAKKVVASTMTATNVATSPRVVKETLIEKQDVVPLYQLNQPSVLYTRLRA